MHVEQRHRAVRDVVRGRARSGAAIVRADAVEVAVQQRHLLRPARRAARVQEQRDVVRAAPRRRRLALDALASSSSDGPRPCRERHVDDPHRVAGRLAGRVELAGGHEQSARLQVVEVEGELVALVGGVERRGRGAERRDREQQLDELRAVGSASATRSPRSMPSAASRPASVDGRARRARAYESPSRLRGEQRRVRRDRLREAGRAAAPWPATLARRLGQSRGGCFAREADAGLRARRQREAAGHPRSRGRVPGDQDAAGCGCAASRAWTSCTAIAPSPTAVAQRLVEPERTSPAAKTPGRLVSSRCSAPAAAPVRMKPLLVARDRVAEPFGARQRAEEEEQERERQTLAALERDGLEPAVLAVQGGDLAAVAYGDAVALELADEVVRHRLAQVGAAMEQRHERAAAREPDRGLAGGVAAADHADARGAAELRLGRPGGVEDAQALVLGEAVDAGAAGTARRSRAAPCAPRSRGPPRAARRSRRRPARARARGRASRCGH